MNKIFIALSLLLLTPGIARSQDNIFEGIWMGKLAVGGVELRIVFNLEFNDTGTYTATMDSPDQGATGIPVGPVEVRDDSLIIHAPTLRGEYRGLLESENTVSGVWTQMGRSMDLDLEKQKEKLKLNRPQEPQEPFPYLVEEVRFKNELAGIELAGTLTLPEEGKNLAAAVLVTGSGPQNRDEEIFGHKPFKVIADFLTRNGIAVLRYDDRGVAGSGGSQAGATSYDFMTDAMAAVNFLSGIERVSKKKIGIIGHSEGGLIAPMLASEQDKIAFVVMLAGPGTSGKQVLIDQNEYMSQLGGVPEESISQNISMMDSIYNLLSVYKNQAEGAAVIKDYTTEELKAYGASDEAIKEVLDNMDSQLGAQSYDWFRYFINANPADYLPGVKCPVLALNGEKDCQVLYKQNLAGIEKGLENNKDVTVLSFPDLNHLFQHSETGLVNEYATIEETFSPEVLEVMASWINERF